MTLEELLSRRIDRIRKEGRENYAIMYERSKKVIMSIIGNPVIEYLTRTDINLLVTKMKERGYTSGGIHMKMAHLKAAINEAVENRWVRYEHDPFAGFKPPVIDSRSCSLI